MHVGHDVDPVDDQVRIRGHPQRDVQYRAVLGDVDVLAAEHRVDPSPQPAGLGEIEEQLERLRFDALLGVVEVPARGLDVHAIAVGLGVEERAQRALAHRDRVHRERVTREVRHCRPPRRASAGVRTSGYRPTGSSP